MPDSGRFPPPREDDVFLSPGEMYTGFAPARVWTILGSCVSIIVWHEELQFGGMTHYLLPERTDRVARPRLDPRYGTDSCKLLLAALRRAGVRPALCRAHVFGGSGMFAAAGGGESIGRRNAAVAQDFLASNAIQVIRESLYGEGHRRVSFDLDSGRVWESVTRAPPSRHARKSKRSA